MPPGIAHMRAVTRLKGDVAQMRNPTARLSARKMRSRSTMGFKKPRTRSRSLRSREHPTNAPAIICTRVRVSVGSHAAPVAMFKTDTPANAPIMKPAGTLSFFAMSPQGTPTQSVRSADIRRLSTCPPSLIDICASIIPISISRFVLVSLEPRIHRFVSFCSVWR